MTVSKRIRYWRNFGWGDLDSPKKEENKRCRDDFPYENDATNC